MEEDKIIENSKEFRLTIRATYPFENNIYSPFTIKFLLSSKDGKLFIKDAEIYNRVKEEWEIPLENIIVNDYQYFLDRLIYMAKNIVYNIISFLFLRK